MNLLFVYMYFFNQPVKNRSLATLPTLFIKLNLS